MAEESVGKVSLDLELKSDLQGQIQGLSGKISSLFKKPLAGLSKSTTSQMNKVTDTVKKSVSGIGNPVKKQMQAVVQSVQSGMKRAMDFSKLSKGFKTSGDDKLNLQYQKQLEALKKQEILVSEIQQKLDRAVQGTAKPTALKRLESELKKVQAEIKKTETIYAETEQRMQNAQFSAKLDKGAHGKVSSGTASEISRLEAELDRLGNLLADSDTKAANLQARIGQMQMNPAASSGADILKQKLALATDKMNRLGAETQTTKAKMDGMKSSTGFFDKLKSKLAGLGGGLKKVGAGIGGFIKKLIQMRSQSKKTQSSIGGLNKGLMRLGTMLKSMILYRGFSAMVNGAKEGFQNLAQYSNSTNQSLSSLMSALTQLKNSFATAFSPILSVVAPILTTFINLLSNAMNKVGAFFAALTGQKSYTRAVSVTQDYASSLSDAATGADDAKKATQDYQNTLAGFDQVTKLDNQKGDDGGSSKAGAGAGGLAPGDMFETVPIENSMSNLAARFKEVFGKIFAPFRQSWEAEGANTIASAKYALNEIWETIKSIGRSFSEVWTNGTGLTLLNSIQQIVQNVLNTVGNLASRFRTAWETAGVGTSIVQGIANIVQTVLDTIGRITGATKDWSNSIDFYPLLSSIDGLLQAIQPLTQNIGDGLSWFYTNVLLPLASWTITDLLPSFLNAVSGALEALNTIIEAAKPIFQWAWDGFLQPIAEWTGGVITTVLDGIGTALKWVSDNFDILAPILAGVITSFITFKGLMAAMTIIDVVKTALSGMSVTQGLVTVAQGLLNAVMNANPFVLIASLIAGLVAAFVTLWNTNDGFRKSVTRMWDSIKGAFKSGWNFIKGIINGIIGGIEGMANGIIRGVNAMIRALNRLHFSIPSWVPLLGGKSFGFNLSQLSTVSIPRLATGGVIDTPTLAMVGEDGQEAVVPLEKNTGWINNLADKINAQANKSGSGGGITSSELNMAVSRIVSALEALGFYVDSELLAKAVRKGNNKLNRRYNTVIFE